MTAVNRCRWCHEPNAETTHPDWHLGCLVEERDALEVRFREASEALGVYLQSGGKYAKAVGFLGGESITKEGPRRLVEFFETRERDLRNRVTRLRKRLTLWRYATGPCPACHGSSHSGDCVLVGVMDDLAAMEKKMASAEPSA